jgi:hypothetical protein
MPPGTFMRLINFWPPLLFCGIHVMSFSKNMREVEVGLRLTWWNHNYVGTQFGGNIYAMTDPFYPLMLRANLGPDFVIWDESAHIQFILPGTTKLHAKFSLSQAEIDNIRAETAGDRKYLARFTVEIRDASETCVATVDKVIYIRPKQSAG